MITMIGGPDETPRGWGSVVSVGDSSYASGTASITWNPQTQRHLFCCWGDAMLWLSRLSRTCVVGKPTLRRERTGSLTRWVVEYRWRPYATNGSGA